jgi:hypothetical protein
MSYGVYKTEYGIEVIPDWESESHNGGKWCDCEPAVNKEGVIIHKPINS